MTRKAPRHVGVMNLWGEPEITVTIRRPKGTAPKKKPPTPASMLAASLVAAYAGTRRRLGLPAGDKFWRGELARAARIVAESENFPEAVLAEAAIEFAETDTKRRPAFFIEWVREAFWRLVDREHDYWKAQERAPLDPAVAAIVGRPLKRLPYRASENSPKLGDGPRRKTRCTTCGDVIFTGEGSTPHPCRSTLVP